MEYRIKGNDIIVLFEVDGEWKTLALGLTCEVDITADVIAVSHPQSGKWPKHKIKRLSWSGSSAHLMTEFPSAVDPKALIKAGDPVKIMIGSVELHPLPNNAEYWPDGRFTMTGNALVSRLTITAGKKTLANMSMEFVGSGEPSFDSVIPEGIFDTTFDHSFE